MNSQRTLNTLDDLLDDVVDLLLGGEAPNTEANRRVRHVFLGAERAEHVRRLERGGGAGGTGGDGDVLDGHEDCRKREGRGKGRSAFARPVLYDDGHSQQSGTIACESSNDAIDRDARDSPSTAAKLRLVQPGYPSGSPLRTTCVSSAVMPL